MGKCFPRAVIAISVVALVGCSSLRVVMDTGTAVGPDAASLGQTLAPNDALVLTRTDGTQFRLHLTVLSTASIDGVDDDAATRVSVPLSQVARIERREFDGVKTAFLVVAIAAGVYVIAKAIAEASLAGNL